MDRARLVQILHPSSDGNKTEGPFSKLLMDCFRVAAKGRSRAELLQVQVALLQRGWHP